MVVRNVGHPPWMLESKDRITQVWLPAWQGLWGLLHAVKVNFRGGIDDVLLEILGTGTDFDELGA